MARPARTAVSKAPNPHSGPGENLGRGEIVMVRWTELQP
jgi:hypothetical protein